MNNYEVSEMEMNFCLDKARVFSDTDERLYNFYLNAALGFQIKMERMTVTEADGC